LLQRVCWRTVLKLLIDSLLTWEYSLFDAARLFLAWRHMARHGMTRHGMTRHGMTRHGMTRHGMTRHGRTRHGALCIFRYSEQTLSTALPTVSPPTLPSCWTGTAGSASAAAGTRPKHQRLPNGSLVLVGSRAWLSQHGVPIPPELEGHAASLEWQGKTVVFVAGGREAKGVLAVADAVRPEAREAVATLHRYWCC